MTTDDPPSEEEHPSLMAHSTPILSSFFDSHFSIGAYFATARPEANGIWILLVCDFTFHDCYYHALLLL